MYKGRFFRVSAFIGPYTQVEVECVAYDEYDYVAVQVNSLIWVFFQEYTVVCCHNQGAFVGLGRLKCYQDWEGVNLMAVHVFGVRQDIMRQHSETSLRTISEDWSQT